MGFISPATAQSCPSTQSESPSRVQKMGKYFVERLNPKKMMKAAMAAATLFTVLQAMEGLPGAEAGFLCFTLCMSACTGGTGGAFVPACVAACVPLCSTNPV